MPYVELSNSLDRDDNKDGEGGDPNHEHVHFVKPTTVQNVAQGEEENESEEVERRLVGE